MADAIRALRPDARSLRYTGAPGKPRSENSKTEKTPLKIRAEIEALESTLRSAANNERAAGEKRYLKSDFEFLGVETPEIRHQVGVWQKAHPDLSRDDLLRLARALFFRRLHELKAVAIFLLQSRSDWLEPCDLGLLESMLRRSYTWAYVDALAIHIVGPLVERHPGLLRSIDKWARDPDFWLRRSALLCLLLPLRRGGGDWNRFVSYADSMLDEREFFIRKAIGWVLREVAKKRPARVEAFVRQRIPRISGVTIREAVKYLEDGEREALMNEYRARPRAGNSSH